MNPEVKIEPHFPHGYPPTIDGIRWATLQWAPLIDGDDQPQRIFHSVEIEEDYSNVQVVVHAHADPLLLSALRDLTDFNTQIAIETQLAEYLDQWRPAAILYRVHVHPTQPGSKGPYR